MCVYIYIHTHSQIYFPQEIHFTLKDTYTLKVKGWNIYFMQMERERKAGVSVLISDKIDFKAKAIVRDKKGHHIMIKETI